MNKEVVERLMEVLELNREELKMIIEGKTVRGDIVQISKGTAKFMLDILDDPDES